MPSGLSKFLDLNFDLQCLLNEKVQRLRNNPPTGNLLGSRNVYQSSILQLYLLAKEDMDYAIVIQKMLVIITSIIIN